VPFGASSASITRGPPDMNQAINRRRYERFALSAMYCPIALRTLDTERFGHEGHAYDISEGGLMFELDRGFEPGTALAIQLSLPILDESEDTGPGRAIFVLGNVVWMDDSEPGPVRLAVAFTRFARFGDRERLLRMLGRKSGLLRHAA
jgi:c-di-GMP-binding flagellar brake protein YcgR